MPSFVNGELLGDKANEPFVYPTLPFGLQLQDHLTKNIAEHGDFPALVIGYFPFQYKAYSDGVI